MNMKNALRKAKEVGGNACTVQAHYGANPKKDRAVRLFGCDARGAAEIGPEIARAIGGTFVQAAGFAAVWM